MTGFNYISLKDDVEMKRNDDMKKDTGAYENTAYAK